MNGDDDKLLNEIFNVQNVEIVEDLRQPEVEKYQPLEFVNPADFLAFFDEAIQSSRMTLHPWQYEVHDHFASKDWTADDPCMVCIVAPNGAGKDSCIIAGVALWLASTQCDVQVVVTSSSVNQVSKQTEPRLRLLANSVNSFYGFNFFEIQKHHIFSNKTGSVVDLYVTDEEGKAEGWHPLMFGKKFMMIFNEAKSISDSLFRAAERCNGFTHWMEISSPGAMSGHFYESTKDPNFKVWRLSYRDCPHIAATQIERIKKRYGENSELFRSSLEAQFTDDAISTLVSLTALEECYENPPKFDSDVADRRAGVDLAAGGDEIVISMWEGNRMFKQHCFFDKNTESAADVIVNEFKNNKISIGYFDDGGVGKGIVDKCEKRGLKVVRVLNQHRAINTAEFANRGAELWFNFARMIQERAVILVDDYDLREQITSRCYTRSVSGKILLESKKDAKSRGLHSPDRADAAVLANCGLLYEDLQKVVIEKVDPFADLPFLPDGLSTAGRARFMRSVLGEKEAKRIRCFQSNI